MRTRRKTVPTFPADAMAKLRAAGFGRHDLIELQPGPPLTSADFVRLVREGWRERCMA